MEDAPKLLKIPKSECPDIWTRLPKYKWPKSLSSMEDPVVPLGTVILWQTVSERQFEKVLLEHGREKVPNWECFVVNRENGLFLSVYVNNIKKAGKKQNIDPMWKEFVKDVDLGEPTSFLDHVCLGCTLRECRNEQKILWTITENVWIQHLCRSKEKLHCSGKLGADIFSWSHDIEGHAKKCVERYFELAYKTSQQLCKVATPCLDDHQFKEEELGSVGEVSKVCSHMVLKCLYLARIVLVEPVYCFLHSWSHHSLLR